MNVIAVKVEESSSRLRLPDGNLLPFDVPDQIRTAMPDGDYMWGVRPEHFSRAEDGKGAISARMEIVQPTGSRAFGTFFIEGTHVVAELGAHEVPQVGASIALSVAMERTSFFHPDSGQAVKPA